MDRQTDRYLFVKTICALLAFGLQQAASALWPWVGVGHDNLVTVDHALVAVVLWVCGGEGRLMARGVGGMEVVLGLIPRRRQDHGQARARVCLPGSWVTWRRKNKLLDVLSSKCDWLFFFFFVCTLRHVALVLTRSPCGNHWQRHSRLVLPALAHHPVITLLVYHPMRSSGWRRGRRRDNHVCVVRLVGRWVVRVDSLWTEEEQVDTCF